MKFRNFDRFGALQYIKFIQFFLRLFTCIVKDIVSFDNAGANLYQRIFTQERIYDGLEHISRFCFCKIIIRLIDFICLGIDPLAGSLIRTWEVTADVVQQICHTLDIDGRSHAYRDNASVGDIHLQRCRYLCYRELFSCKISVHKLFAEFCHRFHQDLMIFLQIVFQIIRYRALFLFASVNILSAGLFYNVYISYEFSILADRHMNGSNLFAVHLCKILYYLTIADVINVHLCHKEHPGQLIFLAKFPCFLGSHLNAVLTGNHDDRSVCC